MIGAKYIAHFLKSKEIKHIFGYQGGAIAKILDEVHLDGYTEYVQNYHEQASGFSACGYAKTNNKLGVGIATSGPGAINLLGGIVDAYCDSVPCLFITGQDYLKNIKNNPGVRLNGFQDLDIVSITKNITKYSVMIEDVNDLPNELEKCYKIATTARKGPVVIDVPLDIQFQEIKNDFFINNKDEIETDNTYELHKIHDVIELLSNAKKPVILCGGGVFASNAQKELSELINILKIPVVSTSNGLGISEKIIGFSGLNGNTQANLAIFNADLLLVLGARLGQQQVGKNLDQYTKAKVIHIDIDKNEVGRIFKNSLKIYSDLKIFIQQLNKKLLDFKLPDYKKWNDEVLQYQKKYQANIIGSTNNSLLNPIRFLQEFLKKVNKNAILTLDVGQNQMWVSQVCQNQSQHRILSGVGYGSMGCSMPYAIGACYATQNKRQIICFAGDGGFQMNMQELMLISSMNLNIKIVIFNNEGLGLIREAQDKYMDSRYIGTDINYSKCPNLESLSKAYNLSYAKIWHLEDCSKIDTLINSNKPCIIEVVIDKKAELLNKYNDYKNLGML